MISKSLRFVQSRFGHHMFKLQLMDKQQQTINQKIQGLLFALKTKDPASLQSHLEDISQIGQSAKHETIQKYKQHLTNILPLEAVRKRKQMNQKLALNQKVIQILNTGKKLMNAVDKLLSYDFSELERGQGFLIEAMQYLNTFESLSSLKYQDFLKIKQQLYLQIFAKIERAEHNSDSYVQSFKKSLEDAQLPLKKDQVRNEEPQSGSVFHFIRALHQESCILSLKKQVSCLLQKQDLSNGQLLQIFWAPSVKACLYHFASGSELHNLQEPGWMFEYLQQVLSCNYKYLLNMILKPLKEEIVHSIGSHFLSASTYFLFMKVIEARIKQDLEQMNPFLSLTFLEELSALEDKLFGLFGLRAGFLETVLVSHQLLLHRAFEYQNERFETKVFEDFININYSQINLKNLQAYNLMVAFLNLLDRLYRKYHHIKNDNLKKQIHRFYRDRIKALVSHLRTSFDRIYLHSRLPRLDILISFKRTENQLRSSLTQLTQVDSELQDCLQKQYYGFLQQYYEACALQALTSTHKKLHISLGEVINQLQSADDSNHDQMLLCFNKIYQEWSMKMDQICKFSRYVDNKLRTIFFTYLEGTSFSLVGLNLFLKVFEPYLQVIFNQERHRNLIGLITCSKERYIQQLQAQPDIVAFLTHDELSKLKNFKNANPNL